MKAYMKFRNSILSDICSFASSCPSYYEFQNFLKAIYGVGLIKEFSLNATQNGYFLNIVPVKKISDVEVEGKIPAEVATRLKKFFYDREFTDNESISLICVNLLVEEGIENPYCSADFSISENFVYGKLKLKVSGKMGRIEKIVVKVQFEGEAEANYAERAEELKDGVESLVSKFHNEFALRSKIAHIRREVQIFLGDMGYLRNRVEFSFSDGILEIDISPGKKTVIFIWAEMDERLVDIDLNKLKDELVINLSGVLSPPSLKNFLFDYLSRVGFPAESVQIDIIDMPDVEIWQARAKISKLIYIKKLNIHGLQRLHSVKNNLKIREKNIISIFYPMYGLYQERITDSILRGLVSYANSKGFGEFRIVDVRKEVVGNDVELDIYVFEGERTVVNEIELLNFPSEITFEIYRLLPRLPTFYDLDEISLLKRKIENLMKEKGYDTQIILKEQRITDRMRNIFFVCVGEAQKGVVKHIVISAKTDHDFIRKVAEVKEGDILSEDKLDDFKNRLYDTQYFRSVNIDAFQIASDSDFTSHVLIMQMVEDKRNEFNIFGGLSSSEGARGGITFISRNILFYGIDFRSSIRGAYWVFPFGRDIGPTFFNIYFEFLKRKLILEFDSSIIVSPYFISTFIYAVRKPISVSLNFARRFGNLRFSLIGSYELRELLSWKMTGEIIEKGDIRNVFVITPYSELKYGDMFVGLKNELIFTTSASLRTELSSEYYKMRKFWGLGVILSFGRIFSPDIFSVPIERRFFLGGIERPRGYQELSIYPIPFSRKPQNKFLTSFEIYGPALGFMRPYIFFDTGDVFHDGQRFDLKMGVGPGIMIPTSFGPVKLDFAYGVQRKAFLFHFSVGRIFKTSENLKP